jgi:hypothetical protein
MPATVWERICVIERCLERKRSRCQAHGGLDARGVGLAPTLRPLVRSAGWAKPLRPQPVDVSVEPFGTRCADRCGTCSSVTARSAAGGMAMCVLPPRRAASTWCCAKIEACAGSRVHRAMPGLAVAFVGNAARVCSGIRLEETRSASPPGRSIHQRDFESSGTGTRRRPRTTTSFPRMGCRITSEADRSLRRSRSALSRTSS